MYIFVLKSFPFGDVEIVFLGPYWILVEQQWRLDKELRNIQMNLWTEAFRGKRQEARGKRPSVAALPSHFFLTPTHTVPPHSTPHLKHTHTNTPWTQTHLIHTSHTPHNLPLEEITFCFGIWRRKRYEQRQGRLAHPAPRPGLTSDNRLMGRQDGERTGGSNHHHVQVCFISKLTSIKKKLNNPLLTLCKYAMV